MTLANSDITAGGAGGQEALWGPGGGQGTMWLGGVGGHPRPPPPPPPRLSLLLPAATLERVLLTLTRFHATFLRDFS